MIRGLEIQNNFTKAIYFEQQKLDEKGLRRFDKELKDTECLNKLIPSNKGFW